ncbi:hypothetical protein [Microvirga splendida]|uniref:DUF4349 domain-containing protein n=1 Tax=Microvirga splendida TaxID=2795727 RepID=A0ABS0Y0V7_9HYPH|nr:hypothetical protein [Microvirga splendida]MBJ6125939.1 hypothetical protein [Microvirga splendida]
MATDRAGATIESAIATHVVSVFERGRQATTVAQIRRRITDDFEPPQLQTGQDNHPPALVALHRRIVAAFAPKARAYDTPDRSSEIAELRGSIERQRGSRQGSEQRNLLAYARSQLLIERQQLSLKNEFTEGFGRIEAWVLSIAFLGLVLLNVISILWALPLLGLSIGRAWYLDRQCKRRRGKIAEIDRLIERIEHAP